MFFSLLGLGLCLEIYGDIFQELIQNGFWLEVFFYFKNTLMALTPYFRGTVIRFRRGDKYKILSAAGLAV